MAKRALWEALQVRQNGDSRVELIQDAVGLDGYIAGPKGEFDWIKTDPDFDFSALFKQFDTIVAGRGTFEPMAAAGRTSMPGMKTVVVSKTLRSEDYPDVVIVPGIEALTDLKARKGHLAIWRWEAFS